MPTRRELSFSIIEMCPSSCRMVPSFLSNNNCACVVDEEKQREDNLTAIIIILYQKIRLIETFFPSPPRNRAMMILAMPSKRWMNSTSISIAVSMKQMMSRMNLIMMMVIQIEFDSMNRPTFQTNRHRQDLCRR
jgi:hypothetical protein